MRPVSATFHIIEENLYFMFAGHKFLHIPISFTSFTSVFLNSDDPGPRGTLAMTRNIVVITRATGIWRAEAWVLLTVPQRTGRPPAGDGPAPRQQGQRERSPVWSRQLLFLRTFSSHIPQSVTLVYY